MKKKIKDGAPNRSVSDVGPGDFIKTGATWRKIEHNPAQGSQHPSTWAVRADGLSFDAFSINRYAKAEDLE